MDLYQQIQGLRISADREDAIAMSPHSDPRDATESGSRAKLYRGQAAAMEAHAADNNARIHAIESLIRLLGDSKFQSANRTLAIRHLEDASMRLQRENGKPE
jgi:hypothetical protein